MRFTRECSPSSTIIASALAQLSQAEQRGDDLLDGEAKFGANVRSKSDTSMVNEALVKFLCHNIVVLIAVMYELGITPMFTGHEPIEREVPVLAGVESPERERIEWIVNTKRGCIEFSKREMLI